MKSKTKEFNQHLYHDIEDEDKAEEYLEETLPVIGEVIMYFNGLESDLDSVLCQCFSDRTDSMGLIVMGSMSYSAKVNLLKRLCDDFHLAMTETTVGYTAIISKLNECSQLRNKVAHANWESIDEQGYTFVKLNISKNGLKQEYLQFTRESLENNISWIYRATE